MRARNGPMRRVGGEWSSNHAGFSASTRSRPHDCCSRGPPPWRYTQVGERPQTTRSAPACGLLYWRQPGQRHGQHGGQHYGQNRFARSVARRQSRLNHRLQCRKCRTSRRWDRFVFLYSQLFPPAFLVGKLKDFVICGPRFEIEILIFP